jgi:hypothetical protein
MHLGAYLFFMNKYARAGYLVLLKFWLDSFLVIDGEKLGIPLCAWLLSIKESPCSGTEHFALG